MNRVVWTQIECLNLAKALHNEGVDSVQHPQFLDTLRRIQPSVLKSERQRPIRTRKELLCLDDAFRLVLIERAHVQVPKHEEDVYEENTVTLEGSIDEVIENAANMAALKFAAHFKEAMRRIVEDGSHDFLNALTGAKIKLKRVTVVGLLPQQSGMISREYGSRLDLRFFGTDDNIGEIKNSAANSAFSLGMVGFMSHSTDGVLAKNENYIRVSGGMSKLRSVLDNLV